MEPRQFQYTPRTHVRERPLHWLIILIAYIFIFLLFIESVAFIVLGAWLLVTPRLQAVLGYSSAIYQRELGFGILLVLVGSTGILLSIVGVIAIITLRILLLRIFALALWLLMIFGVVVGIIGIIFASQVDGFLAADLLNNANIVAQNYYTEKFIMGMNGGLALFMSLTLLVGIVVVRCLTGDVSYYANGQSYVRTK